MAFRLVFFDCTLLSQLNIAELLMCPNEWQVDPKSYFAENFEIQNITKQTFGSNRVLLVNALQVNLVKRLDKRYKLKDRKSCPYSKQPPSPA